MYPFRAVGPRRNPGPYFFFLDHPARRRHVAHEAPFATGRNASSNTAVYCPAGPNWTHGEE
jgi:hypothetical protein